MADKLISLNAALDAFGLSEKTRKYGGDHSGYDTMMLYEIQNTLEDLPDAVRWIPCSERMPEPENAMYWVCTDTGCQCSCRWTNHNRFWPSLLTDWHWNPFDTPQYSKVIAWMPLPEPYKGERK